MSYKVVQKEDKPQQYADPIQTKIDNAAKFGTVYILSDEDNRVQALYNNPSLVNEEIIRQIDRVRIARDGKEYIVVSKTVNFYNRDTGVYVDRYTFQEGIQEEPIVTTNDKGEQVANQTAIRYTIPFEQDVLEQYIDKSNGNIPLSFYEGVTTSNRLTRNKTIVGNEDYFIEANWNELELGKEAKLVSSMVNTLDQVREIGSQGGSGKNTPHGAYLSNRKTRLKPNPVDGDRTLINYEYTLPNKEPELVQSRGIVQNVDTIKINAANQGLEKGNDYDITPKSNVAPTDGIPNKQVSTSTSIKDNVEFEGENIKGTRKSNKSSSK